MSTQLPEPAVATADSVALHPYVAALRKRVRRPRSSPLYLLITAVVAGTMILLPGIYLAMVALWGVAIGWYAVHGASFFTGFHSARVILVMYVGPLIAGTLMLLFLIKPLFARRKIIYSPQAIARRDEPLLFAYVDQLCDTLGSPRPAAIHIDLDANASAGFRGAFSGLFGGKLVLSFGLPLLAGLTLNQFTAVLAHELGHFRQRSAMRLTYIIRSTNFWFARVVYERDSWDETLEELCHSADHVLIQFFAALTRLAVWLSRRLLWLLMLIGQLFSSLLLRQQEFDADRHAACIVGSSEACNTLRSLPLINAAMSATMGDLRGALAERRLPNNIPQLVASRVQAIPDEFRAVVWKAESASRTSWFDSHPALARRVQTVEQLQDPGIFSVHARAATLMTHFQSVCRLMTLELYRSRLQPIHGEVEVIDTEDLEERRGEHLQKARSFDPYFSGLIDARRPIFLQDDPPDTAPKALIRKLASLKQEFAAAVPKASAAAPRWENADTDMIALLEAMAVHNAGVAAAGSPARVGVNVADPSACARRLRTIEDARTAARADIDLALSRGMLRLKIALELARPPAASRPAEETSYELADTAATPVERQIAAFTALRTIAPLIEELRRLFHQQQAVLKHASAHARDGNYVGAVMATSRKQAALLERMRGILKETGYPYAPHGRPMNLAQFILVLPARPQDISNSMHAVDHALSQLQALYVRLLADLTSHALQFEQRLPNADAPPQASQQS